MRSIETIEAYLTNYSTMNYNPELKQAVADLVALAKYHRDNARHDANVIKILRGSQ